MKAALAIPFGFDVKPKDNESIGGEISPLERRPTAVEPAFERVAEYRAKLLGQDFRKLATKATSEPTASNSIRGGLTPKTLRKIENALSTDEQKLGIHESRSELLREWLEVGADLLTLKEGPALLRGMLERVRAVVESTKKFDTSLNVWEQQAKEPTKK